MAIKKYNPTTPGRRFMTAIDYHYLTKSKPEKSLLRIKNKKSGRNNVGKIVVRHKGGGSKVKYRIIDFKRNKYDILGKVSTIEYDPNRNATISLIKYADGEKRYILTPDNIKIGDTIISSIKTKIKAGNSCLISNVPEGTILHNVELFPRNGGKIARSAGSYVKLLGPDDTGKYYLIQLSSGEVRRIHNECRVTIGRVGNKDYNLINFGKAGRIRNMGIRPTVRGSAMNPVDHPHGGGEGRTGIGRKSPLTPWGKKALGVKTRKNNKYSDKFIVRGRRAKKRK